MTMTAEAVYDGSADPPSPGKKYDIAFGNVIFREATVLSVNIYSSRTLDYVTVSLTFEYDKAERNEEYVETMRWYDASDNSVTLTTTATYSSSVVSGGADGFNYTINMPTYEWEFVGEDEVKDMKNLLRKVYVVRREEGGYAFAEFGPYVSKDPEKLVQHVLLKFGSKDAIFADVDLEAGDDKLTFVVQTLSDTVIPELDD